MPEPSPQAGFPGTKPLFEDRTRMLLREAPGSPPKTDAGRGTSREGRTNGDGPWSDEHFRHVAGGAFEATLSGEITDANSGLAKLLGIASPQELVGSSLAQLLADPAALGRVLGHAREGQEIRGEEVLLRTKQGEEVIVLLCTKLVVLTGGLGCRVVGTLMDITERKRRESDLERLAFQDPLTGVANRRALDEHASKYLAFADRRGTLLGLIYLDLIRFKAINDRYGHAAGDAVLVEVARRLDLAARESDVVGRVGGDEFVVLLPDVEDLEAVVTAARRMKTELEEAPVELEDARTAVRAEVGISLYPEHGSNLDELLRASDQATYRAKLSNGDGESHGAGSREDGQTTAPGRQSWWRPGTTDRPHGAPGPDVVGVDGFGAGVAGFHSRSKEIPMRDFMKIPKTVPRVMLILLVAGAFTALSACSTLGLGGGSDGDRGAKMEVRVNNDHSGAERVTVSLMNGEGNRRALGEVSAGERRSFDTTGDPQSNVRHRLMAESQRGETILSPEIVVQENSIVTWYIRDNRVEVFEARKTISSD